MSFDPDKYLAQKKQLQQKTAAPSSIEPEVTDSASVENIKDVLAGLGQGATFGFGDEVLAALQATLAKPENVSWYEDYRRRQKENEEAYKQMQKRSPLLTMGGELVGSFPLPIGGFLKGAKTAATAAGAKATKEALAAGKTIEQAAEMARKAEMASSRASAAKTGAAAAALTGLGASEKTIEEAPELAEEGILSGIVGGVFGAGLTKAGQFVKEYIEESPKLLKGIKAFKLEAGAGEQAPINITTAKGQQQIKDNFNDTVKNIYGSALNVVQEHKQALNKEFAEKGSIVPTGDSLTKLKDAFSKIIETANLKDSNKLNEIDAAKSLLSTLSKNIGTDEIDKILSGSANASDLDNIRRNILANARTIVQEGGIPARTFLDENRIVDNIDDAIEKAIPDIKGLRQNIKDAAQPLEVIVNKNDDPLAQYKKLSDYSPTELRNMLEKLTASHVEDLSASGFRGVKVRDKFNDFMDALKKAESGLQEKAKESGKTFPSFNPEAIEKQAREAADQIAVLKTTVGEENIADPALKGMAKSAMSGSMPEFGYIQGMGKLGRLEANLGQPVGKLIKLGKATTSQLKGWADLLKNSNTPGLKNIGENAAAAFESGDAASKAAMLNAIMQNPEARKLIGVNTGEE